MAVTRLGVGAGGTSTGAAVTFNSFNIVTSDANTVAIVGVAISVSSNSASTTCAVTYGGTAMTQLGLTLLGSTTSRSAVGLYYLFNPGTGTKSVVVTPGGASTKAQVRCQSVAFSGVDTSGVGTAQTASATTHAPTSVANGYDVRVLVNGAALSSPNQTQEYLGGASVGGVGDYMAMQSAAGTGSTISFTCTGTATTPGSIATALTPVLPAASTLTDDFTSNTQWTLDTTGVTVSGGKLNITADTSNHYAYATAKYNFIGSSVFAEVAPSASGDSAYLQLRPNPVTNANCMSATLTGGSLYLQRYISGTPADSGTYTSYNASNHRWWRIRESAGTAYLDGSPNGVTWTQIDSLSTSTLDLTSVNVMVYAAKASGSGTATFDNINLVPAANLTDTFATQDTAKWTFTGSASVSGGQLSVPVNSSYADGANSVGSYNLTGSAIYVQLVQAPNLGNGTTEAYIQLVRDSNNKEIMLYSGGNLVMRERFSGSPDETSITFDPVAHKWWRIRESGGTIYWDTSPDGTVWTNRRNKAVGINLTALQVSIQAGYYGTEPSPGTTIFDNVNTLPQTSELIDNFTTKNTAKWNWDSGATVTSGQLVITADANWWSIRSTAKYNLMGSSISFELPQAANSGGDTTAFYSFMALWVPDDSNRVSATVHNGTLYLNVRVANSVTGTSSAGTYNATTMRWIRLREAAGLVYLDTSPDGVIWTASAGGSLSYTGLDLSSVTVVLEAAADSGSSTTIFDNVNTLPPTSELVDNFTTKDTAKWGWNGTSAVASGQLTLVPTSGYANDIYSNAYYNFTESAISAQLVQTPNVGNGTTRTILRLNTGVSQTWEEFSWYGDGNLSMTERVASVSSTTSIAYSATDHKYLRMRHSGTTIYWDTSPDGATWTNRRSKTVGALDLTNVYVEIYAGYDGTEPSPGTAIWDNFNNTLPKIETLIDTFTTKDTTKWYWNGTSTVTSGQVVLTPTSGWTDFVQTGSGARHSLLGSSVIVKFVQPPNVGDGTPETYMALSTNIANTWLGFDWVNNVLVFVYKDNNVSDNTTVTYDSTNHKWLRIREYGGTIYWDTSADGSWWTVKRTRTAGFPLNILYLEFGSGYSGSGGAPGTAIWDTVNAKAEYLTDNFSTQDTAKWDWSTLATTVGGQASFPPAGTNASLSSVARYSMVGSSIMVEATSVASTNRIFFVVYPGVFNGTDQFAFVKDTSNNLIFREEVGGSDSDTTVTYDAVAHRWWRLRESSGIIYWDTSPDGVTWTNQRNKVSAVNYSNTIAQIYVDGASGTSVFDNLNLVPAANLTDNFSTKDTAKWTWSGAAAVSSGQLQLPVNAGYPDSIISTAFYSLVGSAIYVQITQTPNPGNGTTQANLLVQVDANNLYAIGYFGDSGGSLLLQKIVATVQDSINIAFDSVNHRWLRIREAAGVIYWDTSPDGVTWTNRRNGAADFSVASFQPQIKTGYYGTEPAPGTAAFDNFNLTQVSAINTGQFFAMF